MAAERGFVTVPYDETGGVPIAERVGRHSSGGIQQILNMLSMMDPGAIISVQEVPKHRELQENGLGHYLLNPDQI